MRNSHVEVMPIVTEILAYGMGVTPKNIFSLSEIKFHLKEPLI